MTDTTKIVRLTSGEELLASCTKTEFVYILHDIAILIPTKEGIGLSYFLPYSNIIEAVGPDKMVKIDKQHIMFEVSASDQLLEQYNKMFTKIHAPAAPKIIV